MRIKAPESFWADVFGLDARMKAGETISMSLPGSCPAGQKFAAEAGEAAPKPIFRQNRTRIWRGQSQ
jgi:hypothetical protein